MSVLIYLCVIVIILKNAQISLSNSVNDSYIDVADVAMSDTCVCGRAGGATPRIVGGKKSKPHTYPWMVAIFGTTKIHCSGTLINDRYILTAGHCLRILPGDARFLLGFHDISEIHNGTAIEVQAEYFKRHEDFGVDGEKDHDVNDIGLIKLKTPVVFNSKISPVCLAEYDLEYGRTQTTIAGWGRLTEESDSSQELIEADVSTLSNDECKSYKHIGDYVQPSMLCAYGLTSDACKGDSGGPLMLDSSPENQTGKYWEQIGIISWGIGCARPEMPGVYTRVPYFSEWIFNNTKDAIYCKKPY